MENLRISFIFPPVPRSPFPKTMMPYFWRISPHVLISLRILYKKMPEHDCNTLFHQMCCYAKYLYSINYTHHLGFVPWFCPLDIRQAYVYHSLRMSDIPQFSAACSSEKKITRSFQRV